MEFHFIKLNLNGTYLSLVDPTSTPRYICFYDRGKAMDCVNYVSSFRSRHGIWPSFDMSNRRRKLESNTNAKLRTPDQIKRYLDVETYDLSTIDKIASRTNTSFYCVLHFESEDMGNTESISMSGREMDAVVDVDAYKELLNFSLKII